VSYTDLFYLVDAGQGRWVIRHQITDELAGSVIRTSMGFLLSDEETRLVGTFSTVDEALRGLYAMV
jgi:hypothetical protein